MKWRYERAEYKSVMECTDWELITQLITLLIKYSGPPKMYAVGTVWCFDHLKSPSEKNEEEEKRRIKH